MSEQPYLPPDITAHARRTQRPYVTLAYAQTLDGCLTLRRGQPSPVSGQGAMRLTHELRAAHDAILVGIGTILADDPLLTVRLAKGDHPQPVVLDTHLRFPVGARLASHPLGVWLATGQRMPSTDHEVISLPLQAGQLSLPALLDELGKRGIRSVMVEGGAQVITSFLRSQLVNWAVITVAPVWAGGYHAVGDVGVSDWGGLPRLTDHQMMRVGDDMIWWGRVR